MKKTFAFLSAVLMVSSCVALSASAEEVIIAIDKNDPSRWVTEQCYMTSEKIADFNPSQEIFEFGDIIEYENIVWKIKAIQMGGIEGNLRWYEDTIWTGNYQLFVYQEDQPYSISKVGSIFDNPETEQFIVQEIKERDKISLADVEGITYDYKIDWSNHGYYQPDCVDLTSLHSGDVVSCITYNDVPMLVTEITSAAPPSGDADGNGKLDILDVITVNRAVLGKEFLSSDQAYHADLNQSGAPDPSDSMLMMRKIVGLD